jgi:hypothetical protein
MMNDTWYSLKDEPPTAETAPHGFWSSTTSDVGDRPWPYSGDHIKARGNCWTHWQPVKGPVGLPQKQRPKLPDGWHWDGKRIVRHLTQTYWSAPEQQTTSSTTMAYWVDNGVVHCTDGGGIPVWAVKALEEDGQL